MSDINLKTSTYAQVTWDNFAPIAKCDTTGFPVLHTDLVKQMVWAGNDLVWNGYLVHKDFYDIPNPYTQIPPVLGDPTPVINPRPVQIPVMEPWMMQPEPPYKL